MFVRCFSKKRDQWYNLAQKLNEVVMNESMDAVVWKWAASKKITVKSVYDHLTKNDNGPAFKNIWKSKLPEKIRIFMWFLAQRVVLTKDNMLKKNWKGILIVIFVVHWKPMTICSFSSLLPK
jgi:hypothetical protein